MIIPERYFQCRRNMLFLRALPNKTFALKSEKCTGSKISKERLCTAMNREKRKVDGKMQKQKKNVSILPLHFCVNFYFTTKNELRNEKIIFLPPNTKHLIGNHRIK